MGICEDVSSSELSTIDPTMIKPPNEDEREKLMKRCRITHITQIRQATMIRVTFEKSLRVQSSGVRMLDGDHFTLRIKYELDAEKPSGLRLRHWNGGFAEYLVEKALSGDGDCTDDLDLEFRARDENGQVIRDSEAHIPMRTQVIDSSGVVYAQIDWHTGINDIFDI